MTDRESLARAAVWMPGPPGIRWLAWPAAGLAGGAGIIVLAIGPPPPAPPDLSAGLPEPVRPEPVVPEPDAAPVEPDATPLPGEPRPGLASVPPGYVPLPGGQGFISLFGNGPEPVNWHVSDHAMKDHFMANDWSRENVVFSSGGMALEMRGGRPGGQAWTGGEVQSTRTYGYGRYEVLMRPSPESGLISAFFTYTGPYFGHPHDEIDIEFTGKDTRAVEFNYFRDGKTGAHKRLGLPFDAADALHLYAFDWHPDRIAWYIDGELVYETPAGERGIPRTSGKIYMNIWTGHGPNMRSWHGEPAFLPGASAEYGCVSFTPLGESGRSCADIYLKPPGLAARVARRLRPFLRLSGRPQSSEPVR